jgi:hypothetical protein
VKVGDVENDWEVNGTNQGENAENNTSPGKIPRPALAKSRADTSE